MLVCSAILAAGYEHRYCAQATVSHAHNYTLGQEFRRYFDTGLFHQSQPKIRRMLRSTQSEGVGYVRAELRFAYRQSVPLFIQSLVRNALRALGYSAGLLHRAIPLGIKSHLSHSPAYWASFKQKSFSG